ncbi:MAG: ADP-ribosylglycohydrolase family protein [Chloroflexota bacterium]|nr:ADP-ribosylglycohydrolase family protein [Chloroflexota bacterium]
MGIPKDYEERVYAGVLGKIIGVYMGRPFEGWTHKRIMERLGEINYYVHDTLDKPLIAIDDDISGTFTFLRAMPDHGNTLDLTPAQIGQTWLNYLIEERTILWWGGMGNSTEHTAYLRLKSGVEAPGSGSMERNGRVVAEQIGAQIFIDGWAMISPGDPERAADLARRAASVSHDGEAIHGAQVVAAMEAQAFVESDIEALLDVGTSLIPKDSLIYRLIADVREWSGMYDDWRESFYRIVANYGYDKYGGNVHVVPNHALIILALLYCEDSFSKALRIVNTAGWDTDCNSGNVGCLMGIKNGLRGLDDGPDYRGPVADRMYLPTADSGRAVTDALHEAYAIVQIGRDLYDEPASLPKGGVRFHFDLPGAVQGFVTDDSVESKGTTQIENVAGHSARGERSLAVHYHGVTRGRCARIVRETYPSLSQSASYRMVASPTLYAGQELRARLSADEGNTSPVDARLFVKAYGQDDALFMTYSPRATLEADAAQEMVWTVDVPTGCPIAWVGLELASETRADGVVYLDWLDWSGVPTTTFGPPECGGTRWIEAWAQACSDVQAQRKHTYRLIQNEGSGMLIQGTREWHDYAFSARLTPHLAESCGIAAYVQGLKRYYALKLAKDGKVQLVRELDGTRVLSEKEYAWELYETYELELEIAGNLLTGRVNGERVVQVEEREMLGGGGIALLVEEGRLGCDEVRIRPTA